MKLFAKRTPTSKKRSRDEEHEAASHGEAVDNDATKESPTKSAASAQKVRDVYQSDPIVEELLKQDPSTWNSKERRMIQRYNDRVKTKGGSALEKDSNCDDEKTNVNQPDVVQASNTDNTKGDDDLTQLLGQLPSKERRKIVRAMERKEISSVEARSQAVSLLEEKKREDSAASAVAEPSEPKPAVSLKAPSNDSQHTSIDQSASDEKGGNPAKRRRRGTTDPSDWSSLPLDERLRREDQRRRQQESLAARREEELSAALASPGQLVKHKHPLNSERRRANRRKPKWTKSTPSGSTKKTEKATSSKQQVRNSSGFQMRQQKS
jgi:hypothetical protein